jgi:hypothetical protein
MLFNMDEKTIIARIANCDSEAENYLFSRLRWQYIIENNLEIIENERIF